MPKSSTQNNVFDYIICGGGMSGLSLAYHLSMSKLSEKRILIIDPERKTKNDRTWAFWENTENPFEEILFKKWNQVKIVDSKNHSKTYDLGSYNYKLLKGIDFYNYVNQHLQKFPNIQFLHNSITKILDKGYFVNVSTDSNQQFTCQYAFDSTYSLDLKNPKNHNLLQHFLGFVIKTEKDIFKDDIPEMMNFGITQKSGECRFMYVLPFSKTVALVEFTIFSENLLLENEYDENLKTYISKGLNIDEYEILEREFGVIPMSDTKIQEFPSQRIIRIGTSGGYTNPATGYTFSNTQKKLLSIIKQLESNQKTKTKTKIWNKRHNIYASTLLNVIKKERYPLAEVFDKMFSKNNISTVFKFLDQESNFWEELQIMWSTPKIKFSQAFFQVIFNKVKMVFS